MKYLVKIWKIICIGVSQQCSLTVLTPAKHLSTEMIKESFGKHRNQTSKILITIYRALRVSCKRILIVPNTQNSRCRRGLGIFCRSGRARWEIICDISNHFNGHQEKWFHWEVFTWKQCQSGNMENAWNFSPQVRRKFQMFVFIPTQYIQYIQLMQ